MDKNLLADRITEYPMIFLETNVTMAPKTDTNGLEIDDLLQFSIHYMNQKLQPGQGDLMGKPINDMVNVSLNEFPSPLSL